MASFGSQKQACAGVFVFAEVLPQTQICKFAEILPQIQVHKQKWPSVIAVFEVSRSACSADNDVNEEDESYKENWRNYGKVNIDDKKFY